MSVVIPVVTIEPAVENLMALIAFMEDLSEPLVALAEMAKDQALARYETETDPDGIPWTPLAPSTIAVKDFRGDPGVLRETDAMMESMHVEPPTPYSIEMGYADEIGYAAVHQFGGATTHREAGSTARRNQSLRKAAGGAQLRARATLGVNDADLTDLQALLVAQMERVFGSPV